MIPFRSVEQVRQDLMVGDLIEFHREDYNHWGIYIGNNKVVHVTDDSSLPSGSGSLSASFGSLGSANIFGTDVVVKCDDLETVAGDCQIRINNKDGITGLESRSPDQIVEECKQMIGKPFKYDIFKNNCEHFVTEVKFGKGWSDQVEPKTENERFRQGLAVVSVVGGLATVPALMLGHGVAVVYAAGALAAYGMRRMIPH